MKHKHAELIKAWADGAKIQGRVLGGDWHDFCSPNWDVKDIEFRIKPEEKKPVTRYLWATKTPSGKWLLSNYMYSAVEVSKTNSFGFDIKRLDFTATEFEE